MTIEIPAVPVNSRSFVDDRPTIGAPTPSAAALEEAELRDLPPNRRPEQRHISATNASPGTGPARSDDRESPRLPSTTVGGERMTGGISVILHSEYTTRNLHMAGTVRTFLWTHRNCVAGPGTTKTSCSAREQLLTVREQNGWTFPVPPPDNPAVLTLLPTHSEVPTHNRRPVWR